MIIRSNLYIYIIYIYTQRDRENRADGHAD